MAHSLSLYDGTTTVSLSSGGVMLNKFTPASPPWDSQQKRYGSATETIELTIYAASAAEAQAKIAAIEQMLEALTRRTISGTGPRVYLQYQLDSDASAWRSELLAARFSLKDTAAQGVGQGIVEARLLVERVGFWEGALTQIPLTNQHGTDNTSGLQIYNQKVTSQDNYVSIDSGDVAGSLPAPVKLEMTNTYGSDIWLKNTYYGNTTYAPTTTHILQGEDGLYGSNTANANASGGYAQRFNVTAGSTYHYAWTIPEATVEAFRGRYLRCLVRFASFPTGSDPYSIQYRIRDQDGVFDLATAPLTYFTPDSDFLVDCGALPIPPVAYQTSGGPVTLWATVVPGGTGNLDLDFVHLLPSGPMEYRKIYQRAYQLPDGDALVDDGTEGIAYVKEAGGSWLPYYVPYTEPCHVWPGVNQRIFFQMDGEGSLPAWAFTVKIWYRPRRVTI